MKSKTELFKACAMSAVLSLTASLAYAGPFIIAGTDSDDHGFANVGGNQDGWLFMQKSLENLAPSVSNGNKVITVLGSSTGTAKTAATSAFSLSSLAGGGGWTIQYVDGTTALTEFFTNTGAFAGTGINASGILMMDSADNVGGGTTGAELGVFTANAITIDSFLGAGGGLFSQGNDFAWITALVPTLVASDLGGGGNGDALSLTAAGTAAFPGLNNGDLSSGPYHNIFTNTAGLPVLATNTRGQAVILGSNGGSITNPSVPDASSTLLLTVGAFTALFFAPRRRVA